MCIKDRFKLCSLTFEERQPQLNPVTTDWQTYLMKTYSEILFRPKLADDFKKVNNRLRHLPACKVNRKLKKIYRYTNQLA